MRVMDVRLLRLGGERPATGGPQETDDPSSYGVGRVTDDVSASRRRTCPELAPCLGSRLGRLSRLHRAGPSTALDTVFSCPPSVVVPGPRAQGCANHPGAPLPTDTGTRPRGTLPDSTGLQERPDRPTDRAAPSRRAVCGSRAYG